MILLGQKLNVTQSFLLKSLLYVFLKVKYLSTSSTTDDWSISIWPHYYCTTFIQRVNSNNGAIHRLIRSHCVELNGSESVSAITDNLHHVSLCQCEVLCRLCTSVWKASLSLCVHYVYIQIGIFANAKNKLEQAHTVIMSVVQGLEYH